MKERHSFAATNPCHVYDLALALGEMGALGTYLSGYPRWRLRPPAGFPLRSRSWRTLVTYGLQRFPEFLRPADDAVFRWQDRGFDKAASALLPEEGFLHGLPGQCRALFRAARQRSLPTVLNHAMGPLEQQRKLVAPEYERAGLSLEKQVPLPAHYLDRLQEERELADWHCVASTVVRDQLVADGMPREKIWVVPYGADGRLFAKRDCVPKGPFRICFAGRQSLRKGIHYLLQALKETDSTGWELHCFGMTFRETAADFASYGGRATVRQRGSVAQAELAKELRQMDVLVLPSAEEAFGLVVVQALQVGVPCIVSERVGAKDLLREGETGEVVPFGNPAALADALRRWARQRRTVPDAFPWTQSAEKLLEEAQAHDER
ncbi:MAG: glycosyltransferase [Verrucomicrobia bacterium]|nr:glycosyltransferase [Verrucomicrobiota bacterium]